MLFEIARWRIPKENSKKHLECWREILHDQRSHAEKFYYTKFRILQLAKGEGASSDEAWMWILEYEDREAYDRLTKAWEEEEDPETVKLKNQYHSKWDPLIVPGSFKAELWIETVSNDLEKHVQ